MELLNRIAPDFAPGLGLAKVQQIDSGSGNEGDEDPQITMLRVK